MPSHSSSLVSIGLDSAESLGGALTAALLSDQGDLVRTEAVLEDKRNIEIGGDRVPLRSGIGTQSLRDSGSHAHFKSRIINVKAHWSSRES